MQPSPAKPFKAYHDLIRLLKTRGMIFHDKNKAIRHLSQISYYRFWSVCRKIERDGHHHAVLHIDDVLKLYFLTKHFDC